MYLFLCNEHEASKVTEKEGQLAGSEGVEEGGWEKERGGGRKELINKKEESKFFVFCFFFPSRNLFQTFYVLLFYEYE